MKFQDERVRTPRNFIIVASLLLTTLGVSVLLGWAFEVTALKSVLPGLATMKANTAACMMLCGMALALLSWRGAAERNRRVAGALAVMVFLVGALTLIEYLLGWDFRIDQALFRDAGIAAAKSYPGRMSPSTALCFVFSGAALFVASLRHRLRWRWPVFSALSAAVGMFGAMALTAYLLDALLRFHLWNYTGVAVHTAAGFVLLGTGLLGLVRSEGGLKWSMEARVTRGIFAGVVSLLMVAVVSNNFTYRLQEDDLWVSHTQEVLKEIEAVARGMGDLESAQRGFIITGDEELLRSREETKAAVNQDMAELRSLTADNPHQQVRLDQLEPLVARRNDWGQRTIITSRAAGIASGKAMIALGTGMVLSKEVRDMLKEMREEEYKLLERRRNQSEVTSTKTFLLLPLGLFLSLAMLSLALFFLNAGVSERAQGDEDLRTANAEMRQQASLLDLAPVLVRDMESRILYWSSGVEKLYGHTKQEALGQISYQCLQTKFPVAREEIEQRLLQEGMWEGELVQRARDGSQVVIASQWVLYRDAEGKPVRILEMDTDMTARQRAEALQQRSQKLESLGTLSGGIAHDFNNILLAINGNIKLAIADLPAGHAVQQSLGAIEKAGSRATDLVRRILAFSRAQELKREVIDLQPVVEEALKLVRATLPATVEFRAEFAAELPSVMADSTQVHQIIVNLATNAAHAIGAKSGLIEFRLEAIQQSENDPIPSLDLPVGRYVHLIASDSGCGMDRATLDRVFDPFFTTKPPGEGTGLGLSVVHGIMKTHGGAISVYSEPGRGTAFHLYFPASGRAVEREPEALRESIRGRSEHVLYVDDEEPLVELVTRTLERLGYRVSGRTDATRALEEFRARPQDFDAVVTDLSMPGMSGFELASELLAIRPEIPIVMTSGYVRPEDQEKALQMGLRDLILKPDTIEQLGRTLDRIFQAERSSTKPVRE